MDRPRRPAAAAPKGPSPAAATFVFPPDAAFTWHSESDEPAPTRLSAVDDRLRADNALQRVRRGEFLRYTGDFHNAKQLLGALGRRL